MRGGAPRGMKIIRISQIGFVGGLGVALLTTRH